MRVRIFVEGQDRFHLPEVADPDNVRLKLNGVSQPPDYYSTNGHILIWSGPITLKPIDFLDVYFSTEDGDIHPFSCDLKKEVKDE